MKLVPESILIADDEHLMATGLMNSVSGLGHKVIGPCTDGAEAIRVAQEHRPDLMLLDIQMPEINGIEVAKRMWDEFMIPSIMITAYSDQHFIEQAQETGVFGYLLKPVSTENLRVTISIAWARAMGAQSQDQRIEQLERSLRDRRVIEQAKWHLVHTRGMQEPDAHAFLQREARSRRLRLLDVAHEILGPNAASAVGS